MCGAPPSISEPTPCLIHELVTKSARAGNSLSIPEQKFTPLAISCRLLLLFTLRWDLAIGAFLCIATTIRSALRRFEQRLVLH